MGIDLSKKFSSKTKKAMLLLGEALGLSSGTPIAFKRTISNDSSESGENSSENSDIKTVNPSITDSKLRENIKAMVENVSSIKEVNLSNFFGKNGIMAYLSKSSFTSRKSNFKNIYKSVKNIQPEEQLTDNDIIGEIKDSIIKYFNLEKRHHYKDLDAKFNDGGTIDKCKVVACYILLLGLKQLESKLTDNDTNSQLAAPVVLSGGKSQRLVYRREAKPGEQLEWKILFKDGSRSIAAKLGSSDGPKRYFVHLSNKDQPDKFHLRIVGSADSGKTVLISDAFWCADENKQIADHTANADIIKKWEDTKVFVYDGIGGLKSDGIIDRLKKFYRQEMKSFRAAPIKPAKPAGGAKKRQILVQACLLMT